MYSVAWLSAPDLLGIFIIALILFGPKQLPEVARQLGRAVRDLRKLSSEFTGSILNIQDDVTEATKPITSIFTESVQPVIETMTDVRSSASDMRGAVESATIAASIDSEDDEHRSSDSALLSKPDAKPKEETE
jgi:sec-independent protein translocase protein TatB